MNTDTYMGMFAVETNAIIDDGVKPRTLSGNGIIDFGNPEHIGLKYFEQVEAVLDFDRAVLYTKRLSLPQN